MVIGSRFVGEDGRHTSFMRKLGVRFFRAVLRPILGKPVHDPTSGFVGVNRAALQVFSRSFPLEYPEIEALVVLQTPGVPVRRGAVPDAAPLGGQELHHGGEVCLLYRARAARRVREHSEVRAPALEEITWTAS